MPSLQNITAADVVVALVLILPGSRATAETTSFHVGNSLTWDAQPRGIEALASLRGNDLRAGYHIACNRNLDDIWSDPQFTCVLPHAKLGRFPDALASHAVDVVTLQPWRWGDATLAEDTARLLDFIDLTRSNPDNQDTQFFIYTGWPEQIRLASDWRERTIDSDRTPSSTSREYFELLLDRVQANTDASVYLIPVGEVFFQLGQKIDAGEVPGLTDIGQLYRDEVHASSVGRYIAGATTYATVFAEDPAGLHAPEGFYGASSGLYTPELYETLHATIWQAVRQISSRFVGDYNGNGIVDQGDLDLVLLNWSKESDPAPEGWLVDHPRGAIDQQELDRVLINWGRSQLRSNTAAVPEPRTLALLAMILACGSAMQAGMRRRS